MWKLPPIFVLLLFPFLQNGLTLCLSGKEFTCSVGDPGDVGLIPGSGRSPEGGYGNPLQYSCLENPMDRGVWWAAVHKVAQSLTWPKQLSSSRVNQESWWKLEDSFLDWIWGQVTRAHQKVQQSGCDHFVSTMGPFFYCFWKPRPRVRTSSSEEKETRGPVGTRSHP